jgi:hypothetical protein
MLASITPLQNMHPPPVYWNQSKEVFEEVIFSSNIIKTPKSSRDGAEKKRKKKEKLQMSLQIKGKLTFWEEKDTSNSKILFGVISYSTPPSYHFKNPFQNHWKKILYSFCTII